jgi:hypothetical protein
MRTKIDGDDLMLHFGDLYDENIILSCTTKYNLSILAKCNTIIMDGALKIVHKNYFQLYTIYFTSFNTRIPLVYRLMKRKNQ